MDSTVLQKCSSSLRPRSLPIDLSAAEIPHPSPFLCDVVVSSNETNNVIEHVSNIEYIRWLDRAAELHSDSAGYTRKKLLSDGIMWFVARHEIDYLAEAWIRDELVLATWVRDVHKVKSWRETIIFRPSDSTIICQAATLWVLVNLKSRRPMRIPLEMADALDPLALHMNTAQSLRVTSPITK